MVRAGSADLTVLPETAWTVPWRVTPAEIAEPLRAYAAAGNTLVIGMPLETGDPASRGPRIANSVAQIGPDGEVVSHYDKRHLVPFGEFVPTMFGWFVRMMEIPLGDFARGSSSQAELQLRDQRIGFNVCFEDLFGEELAVQVRAGATVLVNVSNLAWFGESHALDQHLGIARMRALELGRPMLRATNTGVTGVINSDGEVLVKLPIGIRAVLEAKVQGFTGLTPYARYANLPALALALLLVATGAGLCSRGRRRTR
jgi:apolipoprotein N-acyltransferase